MRDNNTPLPSSEQLSDKLSRGDKELEQALWEAKYAKVPHTISSAFKTIETKIEHLQLRAEQAEDQIRTACAIIKPNLDRNQSDCESLSLNALVVLAVNGLHWRDKQLHQSEAKLSETTTQLNLHVGALEAARHIAKQSEAKCAKKDEALKEVSTHLNNILAALLRCRQFEQNKDDIAWWSHEISAHHNYATLINKALSSTTPSEYVHKSKVEELEKEIIACLELEPMAIRVREGGGLEQVAASLAVTMAHVRKHREESEKQLSDFKEKMRVIVGVIKMIRKFGDTSIRVLEKSERVQIDKALSLASEPGLEEKEKQ